MTNITWDDFAKIDMSLSLDKRVDIVVELADCHEGL